VAGYIGKRSRLAQQRPAVLDDRAAAEQRHRRAL
jgi:hypothetical protein